MLIIKIQWNDARFLFLFISFDCWWGSSVECKFSAGILSINCGLTSNFQINFNIEVLCSLLIDFNAKPYVIAWKILFKAHLYEFLDFRGRKAVEESKISVFIRVLYGLCLNGFAYTRKMNGNVWASMSNPILHYLWTKILQYP